MIVILIESQKQKKRKQTKGQSNGIRQKNYSLGREEQD